ncbi:MAG: dynein arm light chain [archaeon]|nr:dynein arm light chain [archaeon]
MKNNKENSKNQRSISQNKNRNIIKDKDKKLNKGKQKEEAKNSKGNRKQSAPKSPRSPRVQRKPPIETVTPKEIINTEQMSGGETEKTYIEDNPLKDDSLLEYDTPFLVTSTLSNKKLLEELDESNENSELFLKNIINNFGVNDTDYSLKNTLNKILPPLKQKIGDQMWVRYVSSDPVTKDKVAKLGEDLNKRLIQEKARTTGVCPIREKLYFQCFDELIRQITINCLERGILLMRVKEEAEMVINQYQMLYESCIAYGIRVFMVADEDKKSTARRISKTEDQCDALEKDIRKLQIEYNEKVRADKEQREKDDNDHKAFVNNYRKLNQYLKADIKDKLSRKK